MKLKPKAQFEEVILGTSQDLIGLKSQASCFDDWLPDIFWEEKTAGASGAASFEWGKKGPVETFVFPLLYKVGAKDTHMCC